MHLCMDLERHKMSQHREEAVTIIRDGKLLTWIEKDYDDDIISPHFKDKLEAINLRADRARDTDELLLSLVLIVLDPLSPITYKDQAYMPNAFNTAIPRPIRPPLWQRKYPPFGGAIGGSQRRQTHAGQPQQGP